MSNFWFQHQLGIIIFLTALLLIAVSNMIVLRRMEYYPESSQTPRVSVLVPARNEEANIERCVFSLLSQDYPDYELIVLDDESTDRTREILEKLAAENSKLRIIKGKPLPPQWLGKHWACHQLAQVASGSFYLFTDADTYHHPKTLRNSVSALLYEQADLLSALIYEQVVSWPERLIVPILPWSIMSFMPLWLAFHLEVPFLSATNGQFMLFCREAYEKIGGFTSVRQNIVDDLALGRRIIAHGLKWRLVDGSRTIGCRMYTNFLEVYEGISKNLFGVFDYNFVLFTFVWLWTGIVFLEPISVLSLKLLGPSLSAFSTYFAALAVLMALALWSITHIRFRFPIYLVLFYPITIMLMIAIATRSVILTLQGQVTWKGRTIFLKRTSWK